MSTATATAEVASAEGKILSKKIGHVGHLVFNNPEKRNAFSLDMSVAAAGVMDDFLADGNIRVIVLSGAGDKAFVSGGDISKFFSIASSRRSMVRRTEANPRFPSLREEAAYGSLVGVIEQRGTQGSPP